jgi:hypothetical protein
VNTTVLVGSAKQKLFTGVMRINLIDESHSSTDRGARERTKLVLPDRIPRMTPRCPQRTEQNASKGKTCESNKQRAEGVFFFNEAAKVNIGFISLSIRITGLVLIFLGAGGVVIPPGFLEHACAHG